jgi:hypothetical protein
MIQMERLDCLVAVVAECCFAMREIETFFLSTSTNVTSTVVERRRVLLHDSNKPVPLFTLPGAHSE